MQGFYQDKKEKIDDLIIFSGINLVSGFLAYALLRSGIKVAFRKNLHFNTDFEPEISNFYPNSLSQTISAKKQYDFILLCSKVFPHLFFPQRLLVTSNNPVNGRVNMAIDKLLNLDREVATLPINIKKYNQYEPLWDTFSYGKLVHEYRFDRNRALVEIYKICLNLGAVIVSEDNDGYAGNQFDCPSESNLFRIKNYLFITGNNVRIENERFTLTVQSVLSDTLLNFELKKESIPSQSIVDELVDLLISIKIPITSEIRNWIIQTSEKQIEKKSKEIIHDVGLEELGSTIKAYEKYFSAFTHKKISVINTLLTDYKEEMNFSKYRQIQSECEQKYDEAKQTGISFSRFMYFFYRYFPVIDEMIERAYELTDKERNPLKIWDGIEIEFLQRELRICQ